MRQAAYGPRERRRVLLVGGLLPLVIAAAGAALLLAWAPRLPADLVVQWGASGPTNHEPLWVVVAGLVVALIANAICVAATLSLTDDSGPHRGRLIIALGVAVTTTATVALVTAAALQLDGASTSGFEVGRRLLLGLAVALPVGALALLLTPRGRPSPPLAENEGDTAP